MATNTQQLLTANQAALAIGMTRERVIRLVQRGELAGCFKAGRWFVQRDAVALFLERQQDQIGRAP